MLKFECRAGAVSKIAYYYFRLLKPPSSRHPFRMRPRIVLLTFALVLSVAACRRIEDRVPAGIISLEGEYLQDHADEALRIVHNTEELEKGNHPLHRIMEIVRDGARIEIRTTDLHLPRRIGHALEEAWGGTLDTHYDEEGYLARVHWRRDQ